MLNIGGHRPGDIAADRQPRLETDRLVEPEFPILDVSEVWEGSAEALEELTLEEQARLRPGEIPVYVRRSEVKLPEVPVTPHEILMKATHARTPAEIGYNGPSVASVSIDDSEESRYKRLHGRDGLYAAMDVEVDYPQLLDTTVVSLAESQGMNKEEYIPGQPFGFEQPGSIILVNFAPEDPLGQKFLRLKHWRNRFYGSCDAPGLFVDAVSRLQARNPSYLIQTMYTAINGRTDDISNAFDLSVLWLTDRADSNAQGLMEYKNPLTNGRGMRHQGWKDSFDSMVHKDGSYVDSTYGVAPIEIQCQTIISLRKAAAMYRNHYQDTAENRELADGLERRADTILNFILDHGWVDTAKGGYFAMGWERDEDGQVMRIETKSIDMHWVLRVLDMKNPSQKELAFQTVDTLAGEDMLTRWGSRVMSNSEKGYGDYRYHCGIWDDKHNRMAASMSWLGLYGYDRFLGGLSSDLYDATGCFPEYIAGIDAEFPVFPDMDLYVFNPDYNELYLAEQIPPLGQTWDATSIIGRQNRYTRIPPHAINPADRRFEQRLITSIDQRYR